MYLAKELNKFTRFSPEWFAKVKELLDWFYELFIEQFKPFGTFKFQKEETPFGWIIKIQGMPGAVTCSVQTNFDMTLLKPNGETELYDVGNDWVEPAHDLLCVNTGLTFPTMEEKYFHKEVDKMVKESARLNELPDYSLKYCGIEPCCTPKGEVFAYKNIAIFTSSAFQGRQIKITSCGSGIWARIGKCTTDIIYGTALLLDDVNGEKHTYKYRKILEAKRERERLKRLRK